MAFRAFCLEANEPFARSAFTSARNFFAIDRQLDHSILAVDTIMIPFTCRFTSLFAGKTTFGPFWMGSIWFQFGTVNRENISVRGVGFRIAAIQYLHFDRAAERNSGSGETIAPNEQSRISARLEMLPF